MKLKFLHQEVVLIAGATSRPGAARLMTRSNALPARPARISRLDVIAAMRRTVHPIHVSAIAGARWRTHL